jgi:hypothetical protein
MSATTETPKAVLVVTGPARERLQRLFGRVYAGRGDVRVVADRRRAERRAGDDRRRPARPARGPGGDRQGAAERRRGDRRSSAPWMVFPAA